MKRRTFVKSATLSLSASALAAIEATRFGGLALAKTAAPDRFSQPFRIPPLDEGTRNGSEVHFKLGIDWGESNFIGNLATPTLGINSQYLGPVLRAKRGDTVSFLIKNKLNEDVALHWHGMKLPAAMDGGPHQAIKPADSWTPRFKINQEASTCWYHAHTHGRTGYQVYHGLAGLFIIDDDVSDALDLPSEYGVDDVPVVIQDRAFHRDGSFRYLGSMHEQMMGMQGDTILVNGVVTPTLKAQRSVIRLRLLNGSNARVYDLAFSDGRPMAIIAADGGFLAKPVLQATLRLAPGERAEIMLDLSDGRDVVLENQQTSGTERGGMMGRGMAMMTGGTGTTQFAIMKIVARSQAEQTLLKLPQELAPLPDWSNVPIAARRKFELEMQMGPRMMMSRMSGGSPFSINGASFDRDTINFQVRKNSFELWQLSNNSMLAHPFHIHNTQFRVLGRTGRSLSATESGLKDTVLVYPGEQVRLLVPFPDYTDPEKPYMYHCHILEHEDGGMMGQFTVDA